MNRFESLKDPQGLADLLKAFAFKAREPLASWDPADLERLKWMGITHRPQTPGFFTLRVRVPSGQLTAKQAKALAHEAEAHGRHTVSLTTRCQVQLRWLALPVLPHVLAVLQSVGLGCQQTLMDSVRNLVGCPMAGLCPKEHVDASQTLKAIDQALVGNPDVCNLPRKVNIAVTGCAHACGHAMLQDIALVAAKQDTADGCDSQWGYQVFVGGKASTNDLRQAQPLDVWVPGYQAAQLVLAILKTYGDHGPRKTRSRARLCHLIDAWGLPRFRKAVADVLMQNGGGVLASANHLPPRFDAPCVIQGVMACKPDVSNGVPGAARFAVTCVLPEGCLHADDLHLLADRAEQFGDGKLRLTAEKNVLLTGVPGHALERLLAARWPASIDLQAPPVVSQSVGCTGKAFCHLAAIPTRQRVADVARALAARLPRSVTDGLRLHWSACQAGCGQHLFADVGYVGRRLKHPDGQRFDAVDIHLGGSAGLGDATAPARQAIKWVTGVPCDQVVVATAWLLTSGALDVAQTMAHFAATTGRPVQAPAQAWASTTLAQRLGAAPVNPPAWTGPAEPKSQNGDPSGDPSDDPIWEALGTQAERESVVSLTLAGTSLG